MSSQPTEFGQYPLSDYDNPNWKPQYLYYALYDFYFDSSGHLQFRSVLGTYYKAYDTARDRRLQLQEVVDAIAKGTFDPKTTFKSVQSKAPKPTFETPLDILNIDNSDVIIELDRKLNWQFSRSVPALTTKSLYGSDTKVTTDSAFLQLYDAAGAKVRPGAVPPDCRILSFRAVARPWEAVGVNYKAAHFNVHVELTPAGMPAVPMLLDPDFPNDGGHIPSLRVRPPRPRKTK